MEEENRVPPLPKRVRGAAGTPGTAAWVTPPGLPDSSLERIRAAFYGQPGREAGRQPAAPSGRQAPLPRRVPGASDGPRPPARGAQPEQGARPARGGGRGGRKMLARRGLWWAGASASVIAIAAGSLAFVLSRHNAAAAAPGAGLAAGVANRNAAAAWVAGQVSRDAIVSCDPAMCQALQAHGIDDSDLLELGPGTADPLGSDVIVATAAIRSEFGGRLSSVYAPAVIASFGTGNQRITVRAIAPDGAAGYRSALSADLLARKTSGAELLGNPQIVAAPAARKQLTAGRVDSRLLTTIAGIAALQPVDIVAFGDSAPGAGPGSPLYSAELAGTSSPARPGSPAHLRSMLAFLHAQRAPYLAAHTWIEQHAGGQSIIVIEFAAPSPPGLLSPRTP